MVCGVLGPDKEGLFAKPVRRGKFGIGQPVIRSEADSQTRSRLGGTANLDTLGLFRGKGVDDD